MATIATEQGHDRATREPPIVVWRERDRLPGALLLLVSVIWLVVPVQGLLADDLEVVPALGRSGAYLALSIGAALALVAVARLRGGERVVVEGGVVAVSSRRLGRRTTWREPLANYHGLRRRHETWPHGAARRSWYAVDLWHPDPGKAIELARAKDPRAIEERARTLAGRLGLPLLEEDRPASSPSGQGGTGDRRDPRPALAT